MLRAIPDHQSGNPLIKREHGRLMPRVHHRIERTFHKWSGRIIGDGESLHADQIVALSGIRLVIEVDLPPVDDRIGS